MKKAPSLLPSPVERGDNDAVIGNKQESEMAPIWRGDAAIAAVSLWESKIKNVDIHLLCSGYPAPCSARWVSDMSVLMAVGTCSRPHLFASMLIGVTLSFAVPCKAPSHISTPN